jgi:hypothetical protein
MISNISSELIQNSRIEKVNDTKYKIDVSKIQEKIQTELSKNKLQENSNIQKIDISNFNSISKPQTKEIERDNPNPYSAFFSSATTISKDSLDYMINGVKFSEEEYSKAKSVLNAAVESLGVGTGKNTNIDYRNYAEMALASNAIDTWCHDNLTDEQSEIVSDAFKRHSSVLKSRQGILVNSGRFTGELETTESYYGVKSIVPQEVMDTITSKFNKDNPKLTGLKKLTSSDRTAMTHIATNQNLIKDLENVFSNVDLKSTNPLQGLKSTYSKMMQPTFVECGLKQDGQDNMVNFAFESFSNILDKISAAGSAQKMSEKV